MIILGIETSCDESAAALVEYQSGRFRVLSNVISSQVKIHRRYGGVVPEVAARNHLKNLMPVIEEAFSLAGLDPAKKGDRPDLISVTRGPGLITSLLVGVWTSQALSLGWEIPLVGVNHMEGHILANWLDLPTDIKLPALCLVVSGGHTEIVRVTRLGSYQVLGHTRDDAAGESYDKVAKLVGLGYPGGPIIDRLAARGNPDKYKLPRPMLNSGDFDFSFSGLKTAVLYLTQQKKIKSRKAIADLAASFQQSVVDVLVEKTMRAAQKYNPATILLAGGVAANSALRAGMARAAQEFGFKYIEVPRKYTTDNAAMIAAAGAVNRAKARVAPRLKADPNWELPLKR